MDQVISGQIKATDIPPTNEKVDVWALGVTIYELVTGVLSISKHSVCACVSVVGGGLCLCVFVCVCFRVGLTVAKRWEA